MDGGIVDPAGDQAGGRPVAVVTGAAGGIGRAIALGLARAGRHLVLVARSRERGATAQDWIAQQLPGASLEVLAADLSSLAATAALGREIVSRHPRVALLVNNAGVFAARREETSEGHEKVLAVNHLAAFVLTAALLPALRTGAPARVVNIGSSTSDRARIDPANLELRHGWGFVRAYAQSKLALMMASFEWAERVAGSGVSVNVVHPGTVATGLVRTPGVIGLAWRLMAPFTLDEAQGADTPLHVALAPELAAVSGCYFKRRQVVACNPLARDAALRRLVWEATLALIGEAALPPELLRMPQAGSAGAASGHRRGDAAPE